MVFGGSYRRGARDYENGRPGAGPGGALGSRISQSRGCGGWGAPLLGLGAIHLDFVPGEPAGHPTGRPQKARGGRNRGGDQWVAGWTTGKKSGGQKCPRITPSFQFRQIRACMFPGRLGNFEPFHHHIGGAERLCRQPPPKRSFTFEAFVGKRDLPPFERRGDAFCPRWESFPGWGPGVSHGQGPGPGIRLLPNRGGLPSAKITARLGGKLMGGGNDRNWGGVVGGPDGFRGTRD